MEGAERRAYLPEGFSYYPEGYLWYVLPVEKFHALPETVDVEGMEFAKKSEFHVTIANIRGIARELSETDEEAEQRKEDLQKLFIDYAHTASIGLVGFEDDLRLAVSSERKSIAVRCKMRGIEGYFDRIKEKYGKVFPVQPAHVSLYTLTGKAVGIDSDEQMESFTKLDLPEVQEVLDSIYFS